MRSFAALSILIGLSLAASGCDRQSDDAAQGAGNAGAASNGITADEVSPDEAQPAAGGAANASEHLVDRSHKGAAMPDKAFTTADGKQTTLKQIADGKPLLVNLWATWCAPCVAELPELDRAAQGAAAKGVRVIAVSQDMEPAAVPAFWKARKLTTLQTWLDPENVLGFHYGTGTLPTTVLYDKDGKEVARIVGALKWDGPDGAAFIAEIGG